MSELREGDGRPPPPVMNLFKQSQWLWRMLWFIVEEKPCPETQDEEDVRLKHASSIMYLAWCFGANVHLLNMLAKTELDRGSTEIAQILREDTLRIKLIVKTITEELVTTGWFETVCDEPVAYLRLNFYASSPRSLTANHYYEASKMLVTAVKTSIEMMPAKALDVVKVLGSAFYDRLNREGLRRMLSGLVFLRCIVPMIQMRYLQSSKRNSRDSISIYRIRLSKCILSLVNANECSEAAPCKELEGADGNIQTIISEIEQVLDILSRLCYQDDDDDDGSTVTRERSSGGTGYDSDYDITAPRMRRRQLQRRRVSEAREYKDVLPPPGKDVVCRAYSEAVHTSSALIDHCRTIQSMCHEVASFIMAHIDRVVAFLIEREDQDDICHYQTTFLRNLCRYRSLSDGNIGDRYTPAERQLLEHYSSPRDGEELDVTAYDDEDDQEDRFVRRMTCVTEENFIDAMSASAGGGTTRSYVIEFSIICDEDVIRGMRKKKKKKGSAISMFRRASSTDVVQQQSAPPLDRLIVTLDATEQVSRDTILATLHELLLAERLDDKPFAMYDDMGQPMDCKPSGTMNFEKHFELLSYAVTKTNRRYSMQLCFCLTCYR